MKSAITYVDALSLAIGKLSEDPNCSAVVEKLTALKEQTEKRNASKSSKPTKTQTANEGLKAVIVDTLSVVDNPVSVTELQAQNPTLGELSNQKVSALIRQLVDNGTVVKTIEKRIAKFALAD